MNDDTSAVSPDATRGAIAGAYEAHYSILEYLAIRKFYIPEEDVRGVIHDVFVSFIRNRHRIENERSWLVGAACIQCRSYWRARGRDDVLCALSEDAMPAVLADDIATRVDLSNVIRRLPQRCRELIHLRFFEQYSSEEIAQRYATTVDYARKLVHRCMLSARALLSLASRRRS